MIVLTLARKPPVGSVARNALLHGAGGVNIDGCRLTDAPQLMHEGCNRRTTTHSPTLRKGFGIGTRPNASRRFPANVVFQHKGGCWDDENCVRGCPISALDEQSGFSRSPETVGRGANRSQNGRGRSDGYRMGGGMSVPGPGDSGGASRFFKRFGGVK